MEVLAKDVMSGRVVSVYEDDTVLQCAQLLRDRNITGAPVLDVEVSEIMAMEVVSCGPMTPL